MSRPWIVPFATFTAAFAVRVGLQWAVGFYTQGPIRWEYDAIARNMLSGRGYVYDFLGAPWPTYGLPVFPFLDAALYAISGGTDRFIAIGVALAAFGAATAALAAFVALRLSGRTAALITGIATAFYPPSLLYSSQLHELPLETFALAVALVAFLAELSRPRTATLVATVAAAAFATFVRPTYGAFVLCALVVLVARRPRFAWRRALLALTVAFVVTLPWTIRNAAVLGAATGPLDPYSCYTLWIGNNPYGTGTEISPDGRSWWEMQPEAVRTEIYGKTEAEQGRIFCDQMIAFVRADPPREVRLWFTKVFWFWWTSPGEGTATGATLLHLYLAAWLVIAGFALAGTAVLWRSGRGWELAIVLSLLLPISLAQATAYVQGRHRTEVEWAVLILAAIGVVATARAARPLGATVPRPERQIAS